MNVADPGTGDIRDARRAFLCLSHSPFMTLPGKENAGERYRGAVENAKRFIVGFRPDVIVMFAPDHMNLLNELRPPFTGILSGSTLPEFGIPELALTVHPLATDLYQQLVAADVDLAVGEEVKVDHGLGLTLLQLFDEPGSAPLTVTASQAQLTGTTQFFPSDTVDSYLVTAGQLVPVLSVPVGP